MNGFHGSEQLSTQADHCADSKATFWLAAPKLSKIATLEVHHHIVEFLIAATADKSTNMILAYNSNTPVSYLYTLMPQTDNINFSQQPAYNRKSVKGWFTAVWS